VHATFSTPLRGGAPDRRHDGAVLTHRDRTESPRSRPRRRIDRGLLLASLAIAVGAMLIVWGLAVAVTGDEGRELPAAIESVSPPPNAEQVPEQSTIFADLQSGYEATLSIDDVDIPVVSSDDFANNAEPGQQVDLPPMAIFERGNATITFTPSEDAPIESLTSGTHRATLVYWKSVDGPDKARTFHWEFNVL
jgi:hypothetical protein